MDELAAYKELFGNCFSVEVNMNDTFYYACADSETIEYSDVEELIPYIQKYGYDAIVAYSAVKRGHNPSIPRNCNEKFLAAKVELQHLADVGQILHEQWWDNNKREKQRILFDGQIPEWRGFHNRFQKILNKDPKVSLRHILVAKLPDGTLACGGSYNGAETRLKAKFDRKKARLQNAQ